VDENGQTKNPTLSDCGQAVSTVKALAIAQQQGQKIYTITQQNASTALAKLPVSGSVGQEIRNAIQAGKEVTIHEKPINAYGWSGYGYSIIDPETGAGGYVIEGGGNGALYIFVGVIFLALALTTLISLSSASVLVWNIVMSEVAIGVGYILMGLGLIYDNQDAVNLGAALALGGIIGFSAIFIAIGKIFALISAWTMSISAGLLRGISAILSDSR
jgi:hypothetical protein